MKELAGVIEEQKRFLTKLAKEHEARSARERQSARSQSARGAASERVPGQELPKRGTDSRSVSLVGHPSSGPPIKHAKIYLNTPNT